MGRGLWLVDGIGGSLMPGPFYFAWAGGTIADQLTIVTTGNTHGGSVETFPVVADTDAGDPRLFNMAGASVELGSFYGLEGPGIIPGTAFLGENGVAVYLTNLAQITVRSAYFTVTKAIDVGVCAGAVQRDHNFITLPAPLDLPPALYGIRGEVIPPALFQYDGGLSITLLKTGPDGPVPANCTATGTFYFQISGMPNVDWQLITGIPGTAIAALTPGLRYNISGNGIDAGTTFIAPDGGASIEIDQPAKSSQIGALLTVSGPRTPDAPFDPAVHNRFDEDVLGVEIEQSEGDFATLTIDIKNQGIGLLATGRNLWCWLSWDQAWTPDGGGAPDLVPLFNGRLIGVPKQAASEVVQLQFNARPEDFVTQKRDLADSLMVLPFWDPVWLTTQGAGPNPDTVLEAYSALWHIDRTSLEVTVSDVLQGEDGIITIGEDQAFYDAFTMSFGNGAPLQQVSFSGTVSWEQRAEGLMEVTSVLKDAFSHAGHYVVGGWFPAHSQETVTDPFSNTVKWKGGYTGAVYMTTMGSSMEAAWPKPGTNIGGGWGIPAGGDGSKPYSYFDYVSGPNGAYPEITREFSLAAATLPTATTFSGDVDTMFLQRVANWYYTFNFRGYSMRMVLEYKAARKRTETVRGVLVAGIQTQVFDTTGSVSDEIAYTSDLIALGIEPGGGIPMGSPAYRSYFQTDRGAASLEYLLMAARAKLRIAARSAEITFAVDWRTALGLTLRNSVELFDRRLPGGSATGKVKHYRLTAGEHGMYGEFTIGCSIGLGSAVGAATGTNAYVEDGYVDPGYQVVAGGQYMLLTDELAYQTLDQFVVVDDGLDLTHLTPDKAVNYCIVTGGDGAKLDQLNQYQGAVMPLPGLSDPQTAIAKINTTVILDLKPVTGAEYHTDFLPAISMLRIPQTIDLAAPAGGESMWDATHPAGDSAWDSEQSGWDQPPALRGSNGQQNRSYQARARQPDHGIRAG
jgi:hypothetical protein